MASNDLLQRVDLGAHEWNAWRTGRRDVNLWKAELANRDLRNFDLRGCDLREANLRCAALSRCQLDAATLTKANMAGALITDATFIGATLFGADLSGAVLSGSSFIESDTTDTDLRDTTLHAVTFKDCWMTGAKLCGARLGRTSFTNIDLSNVGDLEQCLHEAPSFLDYFTLARSARLPTEFLRGCGLSDRWITYLPSLREDAVRFNSCFISYSNRDDEFASRLHGDLQKEGVRCWFAPHDMKPGKKIHDQIDEAIRVFDRLLLVLSTASMDSEWVHTEIAKARKREHMLKRRVLFPLSLVAFDTIREWSCFDADTGKDSAREIREYFIPDFSGWTRDDEYRRSFRKLMEGLRAESGPPTLPSRQTPSR